MSTTSPTRGVFVTGTDTGVGKTFVSVALLRAWRARTLRAVAMKPVASGCLRTDAGWRNGDAIALAEALAAQPRYDDLNPYALPEPVSPHLAARAAGVEPRLGTILAAFDRLRADAERVLVEGAGGWMVPISDRLMQSDLVRALDLPVLLVVGVRLGCINHALLSARAIEADGCRFAGWIANTIDPKLPMLDGAIAAIEERLGEAPLAVVRRDETDDWPAAALARLRL